MSGTEREPWAERQLLMTKSSYISVATDKFHFPVSKKKKKKMQSLCGAVLPHVSFSKVVLVIVILLSI